MNEVGQVPGQKYLCALAGRSPHTTPRPGSGKGKVPIYLFVCYQQATLHLMPFYIVYLCSINSILATYVCTGLCLVALPFLFYHFT